MLRSRSNYKKNKSKKKKEKEDYSIKDCQRIVDAYVCPFDRLIKLIKVAKKNNKHNKQEDLPTELFECDYSYECESCAGCPYVEKYGKKCSVSKFKEKSTPYINELINSFVSGKFEIGYSKRFPVSEGINGYLKRKHGTPSFTRS